MNATAAQPGSCLEAGRHWRWLWLLAALAVALVAVNGESLWVDEALTANEVSHASFHGIWTMLAQDRGSDLQMPLYLFHLWAWVKMFGTSEWALRAINIPWFLAAMAVCVATFEGRMRTSILLAAFLNSFVWYFLNEARPYAVQISASLMAFGALCRLAQSVNGQTANVRTPTSNLAWLSLFLFGVVSLSASSLLGMVWAMGFVMAAACIISRADLIGLLKAHRGTVALSLALLFATGAYYLWTLMVGARATGGKTDIKNIGFVAYELFGFGGLGPGRLDIRGGALGAYQPYLLPLGVYAGLLAILVVMGMTTVRRRIPGNRLICLVVAGTLPAAVLIATGCLMHFRVLDRHCAPLLVVVIWLVAAGICEAWGRGGVARAVVCAFLAMAAWSCLEIRFAERHQKDDYRDAVADAKAALARGERVWWNAGWHGAVYYQLPLGTNAANPREAFWILNASPAAPAALPAPDVVISSKPDMFDQTGAIADFLRTGPYAPAARMPAFIIWTSKTPRSQN